MIVMFFGGYGATSLVSRYARVTLTEKLLISFPLGSGILGISEYIVSFTAGVPINSLLVYTVSLILAVFGAYMLAHQLIRGRPLILASGKVHL